MNPDFDLRELDAGAAEPDWDAMEAGLLREFAQQHAPAREPSPGRTAWWHWATAAVIVLAAAVTWYQAEPRRDVPRPRDTRPRDATPAPPPRATEPAQPVPAAPPPGVPERKNEPVRRLAAIDEEAVLAGFITLPGASTLPNFESGRIVRVELPVAMLPAYGLEVMPDGVATDVEADLLVGQDGVPRAIRFSSDDLR